jgi:hypothetical protein
VSRPLSDERGTLYELPILLVFLLVAAAVLVPALSQGHLLRGLLALAMIAAGLGLFFAALWSVFVAADAAARRFKITDEDVAFIALAAVLGLVAGVIGGAALHDSLTPARGYSPLCLGLGAAGSLAAGGLTFWARARKRRQADVP